MHPGEQSLELTTAQRCTWIGLRVTCVSACKSCENCAASKKQNTHCGLLPPKPNLEIISRHTLCTDLLAVGPCKFGNPEKPKTHIELHCVTVVDPATGFFETVSQQASEADSACAHMVAVKAGAKCKHLIVHLSGERTAPRDLEPNLSQTPQSFQIISQACNFHLQTTQKVCGFQRGAQACLCPLCKTHD